MAELDVFEAFEQAQAKGARDPYPEWAEMRRRSPVHEIDLREEYGLGDDFEIDLPRAYVVLSYDGVTQVLRDPESFSSSYYGDTMGVVMGHSILEMDEPEHHLYRGLIQQAFTRKALDRWQEELVRPMVASIVDQVAARGRADLVRELTFPFPVRVIAGMLGLPAEDLPQFHRWAVELISVGFDFDLGMAASQKLRDYFATVLTPRRDDPRDDLVSVLAHAELDGQRLDDEQIFAFLRLLLPAGAETTYRSSSNLLFGLLTNPAQLAALLDDRSLLPQAIEEGIRWEPPLTGIARWATRDMEVDGVPLAGQSVVNVNMGAANRDESRWERPGEFDILRPQRQHVSFALGPHTCLGMHLARMETAVAIETILDRLPALRLDPDARDVHIRGRAFRSPQSLPVLC
ncbi:MAG: cytochrome P450 [Acidimicrobiia bacterium]|nr:cytochrome P450 [Acidimicrobiia bacterium]